MDRLNLKTIFEALDGEKYCVIKPSEIFPLYDKGSDIDIFCYSLKNISRIIINKLSNHTYDQFSVKVCESPNHIYIDYMEGDDIDIRFDLYGDMPVYANLQLRRGLFGSIIERSSNVEYEGCALRVPSKVDDLLLRYIEYNEWFSERPDKIKHIDYINNMVKDSQELRAEMLDRLHHYIALPEVEYSNRKTSRLMRVLSNVRYAVGKIMAVYKRDGLKILIKKLVRRYR